MGLLRGPSSGAGLSSGVELICWRRSGEALSRTKSLTLALTATEACVRACKPRTPLRTSAEFRPLQFHCGRPPPAPDPSTLINMMEVAWRAGARLVKGNFEHVARGRV